MLMARTTNAKSDGFSVKLHEKSGQVKRAILYYRKDGPLLEPVNHNDVYDLEDATFSFTEDSQSEFYDRIDSEQLFAVAPEVAVVLNYEPDKSSRFEMYPPCTGGWLPHVVESGYESVFTIQNLIGKDRKLLSIVNTKSNELYFIGIVQSYEQSILLMNRDLTVLESILYSDSVEESVFDILKDKPPSWSTLSKLLDDMTVPNLVTGQSMGDTLNQLVPQSFSPDIRRQILAFLAWLESAEVPNEDPTDFVRKYRSVGVFRQLARGHLQCLLDDVEPPKYVRVMHLADKSQLELAKRPQSEAVETDPWTLVQFKLYEMFPDWTYRVVKHAIDLQKKGRIATSLPVSRDDAKQSKKAWSDRFALESYGLSVRGHVHKDILGLIPVVYLGSAHRWPHNHLEWSARLGYAMEKPHYIQILVMPPSAYERTCRVVPNLRQVDWEYSTFNLKLYNDKAHKWKLRKSLIVNSLYGKRSLRQLENEFRYNKGKRIYHPSQQEARILDLISWGMYLGNLENDLYAKYYNTTNSAIEQDLETMLANGVFSLQYLFITEKLRSLCLLVDGPPRNVYSISRAFLKHAPSTQVRITNGGHSSVIVSRIPDGDFFGFVSAMTEAADENDISVRASQISAYAGYRNNLYSRLLKPDGSWDDDVSGLLSQVRLPPRNKEQ
jgi:hypothetical protein